jgi:DNA ligase-1
MRPFQELMRRRRKTNIEAMSQEVPVALFFFDILFLNGEDVSSIPMLKRRKLLEKIITTVDRVSLTTGEVTEDPDRLDAIFIEAINSGHEGVIAKAIHGKSGYQAGSRSWLWIKLKASYKEGISDSVDLVIVGAIHGRGKRAGLYGAILASAYDDETDTFPTVCNARLEPVSQMRCLRNSRAAWKPTYWTGGTPRSFQMSKLMFGLSLLRSLRFLAMSSL